MSDKTVLFTGYRMAHPLEHNITVKIQTTPNTNPGNALKYAIQSLQTDLHELKNNFEQQIYKQKESSMNY